MTTSVMLWAAIFGLVTSSLPLALAVQAPLSSDRYLQTEDGAPILADGDVVEWKFDKLPNSDDTDHFVFETVHSLLQHWPNTRMRNGHTIVPGSIPLGTLLYHGTSREELPPGPDWAAMEPEQSYLYCRHAVDHIQQGCWHLTLATTRPLKVVYFDGSSAAILPHGSLDTQDLITLGRLGPAGLSFDWQRILELCEWGKKFSLDGFVRMGPDFEVMLCDFTSGVRVVSFLNLASSETIQSRTPISTRFEVTNSASWHSHFPGETRVQLDLAGLVSFYDTQLTPSLVSIRAGQDRWDHRAGNISAGDLLAVKSRLEATLKTSEGPSNGVDWRTLVRTIVDRYAQRLEFTRHLLNSFATDVDEILDLANKTQNQLRAMLTPYLLFTATPTYHLDRDDSDWMIPIYKLCATTHTHSMESQLVSMTDSEKLMLKAVRGTNREICRVVTRMWTAGVYAGIDPLLNTRESLDISEIHHLWTIWADDLDGLMKWLDWNVWVKCHPECGAEAMCYLPTWPVGFPGTGVSMSHQLPPSYFDRLHPERRARSALRTVVTESLAEMWKVVKPEPGEWVRPQPKCIRRMDPYDP